MVYIAIIAVAVSIFAVAMLYEKTSILKAFVLGLANAFFAYVLSSAMLFWVDVYSVERALILTTIILVILGVGLWIREKRIPELTFEKKEWLVLCLILLTALPLSANKFGYFGMGQDQGVYQTKAIELMQGNNQRVFEFEEYEQLETEEQKKDYFTLLADNEKGYNVVNRYTDYPVLNKLTEVNDTAGIYHGIPTWPSLLALFGNLFGMKNMQQCQSVFLVLLLMILFYILENCRIKTSLQVASVLLLGVSPLVVWVSRSALTEMFLSVIIATFVLLLTEKKDEARRLSYLPIIVFAFYHVTLYTIMPMFVLIYWLLYMVTEDREYIRFCNIILGAYFVGFCFMLYISPRYTLYNYFTPLSKFGLTSVHMVAPLVMVVTILALFMTNMLVILKKQRMIQKLWECICKHRAVVFKSIIAIFMLLFAVLYLRNTETIDFGQFTLIAIMMATGGGLLPTVLVKLLIQKKEKMQGTVYLILSVMFVYTVLVYSTLLNVQCAYYYYYGRYIVPYLFVTIVLFCYLWNEDKRYKIAMLAFVGILYFVEPNYVLYTHQDDTWVTWDVMENVLARVEGENRAVVVADSLSRQFFLPISSTGCAVYEQWDDLDDEIEFLSERYDEVFVIGDDLYGLDTESYMVIYRDYIETSINSRNKMQALSSYPLEFTETFSKVTLYRYNDYCLKYDVTSEFFLGSGFGSVEVTGNAWTQAEKSEMVCYLEQDDYMVMLQFGAGIPLDKLGIEAYKIDVQVNEKYLTTIEVDNKNNGGEIWFYIPKEFLDSGKNIVTFTSELWSPSDYGSSDTRTIGFCFDSLNFFVSTPKLTYRVTDDAFMAKGFLPAEADSYAWTMTEEAEITCILEKNNYHVTIKQGVPIPLESLGLTQYTIAVFMNEEYVDELIINEDNSGQVLEFDVPEQYVEEGKNVISFESQLWSPADYGSEDTRNLGFCFESIEFKVE